MTYKTLNTQRVGVRLTEDSLSRIRQEQTKRQADEDKKVSASRIINECVCEQLPLPLNFTSTNL